MHTLYQIVGGPLVWMAFAFFIGGLGYRFFRVLVHTRKSEPAVVAHMSWHYSLRSIAHWVVPFVARNWRLRPVMTVITFAFHLCLLITPIFTLGHVVLWEEAWGGAWWALPDGTVDIMTLVVLGCCLFFAVRRCIRREVRYVTGISDYLLLLLTAAPFITGYMAYNQYGGGDWMTLAHMISGELLLAVLPFTRLSHMLLGWFTRAYIGSEFGAVRHARDW